MYILDVLREKNDVPNTALLLILSQFHHQTENFFCQKYINVKFIGIVGYADDLLVLSPTLDGLQEMVKTCEEFATRNNLKFSTHHVLTQCKTKCMAFTKKKTSLKDIIFNGKVLPSVRSAKSGM